MAESPSKFQPGFINAIFDGYLPEVLRYLTKDVDFTEIDNFGDNPLFRALHMIRMDRQSGAGSYRPEKRDRYGILRIVAQYSYPDNWYSERDGFIVDHARRNSLGESADILCEVWSEMEFAKLSASSDPASASKNHKRI